ncbi:MAG: YlxR family protein [Chloroflexi bacterium]|nr:YlxR family protein [Chloroflexota bacterium]
MSKATATPSAVATGRRLPQRTCVSCRTTTNKRDLVRLVRTPEGNVTPDPGGKAPGRGAYLCREQACWDNAIKQGVLERALRTSINEADAQGILDYRRSLIENEVAR